jgi:Arc/MetJ family transcription regulator
MCINYNNYVYGEPMRTNIELDDHLVAKAMTISGIATKKGVVHLALEEFGKANNRKKISKYRGNHIWGGKLEEMRASR